MIRPRIEALSIMLSLATLSATAFGQSANPARPGTLNYVEGQASIQGQAVNPHSVGQAGLNAGQYIATANGKAEVLLTPGVFLRLGNETSVKMISPNLTHTEVAVEQGRATLEVDQLYKQNTLLVDQKGGQSQILKDGFYEFSADNSNMRVFQGEAAVYPGDNHATDVKPIKVKSDRQLTLDDDHIKPQKFDAKESETRDDLYAWSDLRSQYLGNANLNLAETYAGGNYNYAPGWAWAGYPYGYTWLPGDGLFWNPFGFGFYSPGYIYGGGFIYGYPGGYGHPVVGHPVGGHPVGGHPIGGHPIGGGGHPISGNSRAAYTGSRPSGASGSGDFHGGGSFSGSGGGFHSGGGGGFHGGGGGGHR